MVNWETVLTSVGVEIGQVDISRGIFQGDSLSPLLFIVVTLPLTLVLRKIKAVYINHRLFMDNLKLYGANKRKFDSLIQPVRIFSEDIGMSFALEKCAVLEMRRGRKIDSSETDLSHDQQIGEVEEESYR